MDENAEYVRLPNEIKYEGMLLNSEFMRPDVISKLNEIDTTDKDIIIAANIKSGTTWVIEIVYLLQAKNKEVASKSPVKRDIFLEFLEDVTLADERLGEKRILKTHLPARFLNKQIEDGKAKVIVVMRHPKDTLVSLFNFYRMNSVLGNFDGSWDDFFELFKHKGLVYADWLEFNKSYWQYRTKDNVMFITYEDVKTDTKKCIHQLASFLNISCTAEDVDTISRLVDFGYMKENNAVNHKDDPTMKKGMDFIHKGKSGRWKEVFTVEQSEYVDSLYEGEIKRLGLPIVYK